MNAVILRGTVTEEPHLRYTPRAVALLHLHLAGKTHGRSWYHRVNVFGALAEGLADTAVGVPVTVAGRLQFRSWTNDAGERRSALDVVATHGTAGHAIAPDDAIDVDAKGQPVMKEAWNRAMVAGNLTRDSVGRTVSTGDRVADGSLAVNERVGDEERAHFIDVTAWRAMADVLETGEKGDPLIASGRVVVDSWEGQDGRRHFRTKIDADHVDVRARRPSATQAAPRAKAPATTLDDEFPPEEELPF